MGAQVVQSHLTKAFTKVHEIYLRHRRRDEQAQMSREINIAPQQRRRRQRTQPHPLATFTTHQRHLAELLT